MKSIIALLIALMLLGCAPTPETIRDDLLSIREDIQTIAANANPVIQRATVVANIVETASGNEDLIPLTNAVSIAVQAANIAVAKSEQ